MRSLKSLKPTSKCAYALVLIVSILMGCNATRNSNNQASNQLVGPVMSCGNASIFQLNKEKDSYVLIQIDMASVSASKDLKIGDPGVEVKFLSFDGDVSARPCNDIMSDYPKKIKQVMAKSGVLNMSITDDELAKKKQGQGYRINIKSTDLQFTDGRSYEIDIKDTYVGWLPG